MLDFNSILEILLAKQHQKNLNRKLYQDIRIYAPTVNFSSYFIKNRLSSLDENKVFNKELRSIASKINKNMKNLGLLGFEPRFAGYFIIF